MLLRAMLYVRDLPEMADFYTKVLGLSAIIKTPEYVDFGVFALHAIPRDIAANIKSPTRPSPAKPPPPR